MNVVRDEVIALVTKEYNAANKKWKPYASNHEAWAVCREEVFELIEETKSCEMAIEESVWRGVRIDMPDIVQRYREVSYESAVNAAVEAIQVAAVCRRWMDIDDGSGK